MTTLRQQQSSTYAYDNNGNLLTTSSTSYTWDYRNRLTQLVNGVATTTYTYDAADNRISQTIAQTVGSTTTASSTFYPNKYYSIVSSANGATTTATSTDYIYLGSALLATIDRTYLNGVASSTTTTHYIHPDHLGSTNIVTDKSGNPSQTLEYYPYGATRLTTGTPTINRQYIGQFTDPSGLSYLNARYYNSTQGQFLSEDPVFLGNPSGQDLSDPIEVPLYSFCESLHLDHRIPTPLNDHLPHNIRDLFCGIFSYQNRPQS